MIKRKKGKIANAVATTYNDIKFKSRLEVFMYKELKKAKIKADYEQKKYVLMEGFIFAGKKIRPITYTPDFVLRKYPVIIETKGFMTDVFKIKMKMLKWNLVNGDPAFMMDIYMPRNQKDCLEVIKDIKEKYKI